MPFHFRKKSSDHQVGNAQTHRVPQGPPLSSNGSSQPYLEPPPAYEEWMAVQENPSSSGLPPPPSLHHFNSPVHNATSAEEQRANDWCARNPLLAPQSFDTDTYLAIINGQANVVPVNQMSGRSNPHVERTAQGHLVTSRRNEHQCLCSSIPLFPALHIHSEHVDAFTSYFEVRIIKLDQAAGVLAIGFFAPPYPSFRLPGWQRASIGVHSDDGRRYVNDTFGGNEFTTPFKIGDVIGIGMEHRLDRSLFMRSNGVSAFVASQLTMNSAKTFGQHKGLISILH